VELKETLKREETLKRVKVRVTLKVLAELMEMIMLCKTLLR